MSPSPEAGRDPARPPRGALLGAFDRELWRRRLRTAAARTRRRAEEERRASDARRQHAERRVERVLQSAYDAFVSVDGSGRITDWNRQAERIFGYARAEVIGRRLEETIVPPELRARHATGFRRAVREHREEAHTAPVELAALHRDGHRIPVEITVWLTEEAGERHAHAFIRDISERKAAELERERAIAELRRSEAELARSRFETIRRLAAAAEHRDPETGQHVERMSRYAALLAEHAGLDPHRRELLRIASPLHDVGKIGIPDQVLRKPGPLTPEERREMERHTLIGHEILSGSQSDLLDLAALLALTHHERVDGSGYPHGLRGDEIPLEGRIAAIADVFDALTSERVYRPAMSIGRAVAIMRRGSGSHFDAELLHRFLTHLPAALAVRDAHADGAPPRAA